MRYIHILTLTAAALAFAAHQEASAQTIHDALRFSREDLYGTARSMAMGGAMTAVGGDLGALSVNPAASGVYRCSEFTFSPGIDHSSSTSDYLGNSSGASKTRFALGSVGFVGYVPTGRKTGLMSVNWSVSGRQTGGYVSATSASGHDAASSWLASKADEATWYGLDSRSMSYTSGAPWDINGAYQSWQLNNFVYDDRTDYTTYVANTEHFDLTRPLGRLDQRFSRESWGYTYDFDINASANISDRLFVGLSLTAQSIYYRDTECYSEDAVDKSDFETGFEYMDYCYSRTTRGVGFKLSAGLIYRPFAGLSIGASVSTPTWKNMRDWWTQDVQAYSDIFESETQKSYSPEGEWRYRMTTPFRWNAGLAYTIGKVAVISAEYSGSNTSEVKFRTDGSGGDYTDLNSAVSELFSATHTVRFGAEVRTGRHLSVRGGYNISTSPIDTYLYYGDDLDKYSYGGGRQTVSGGLGWRSRDFFVDLAFQYHFRYTSEYLLYDDYNDLSYDEKSGVYTRQGDWVTAPLLTEKASPWRILVTFGFKF